MGIHMGISMRMEVRGFRGRGFPQVFPAYGMGMWIEIRSKQSHGRCSLSRWPLSPQKWTHNIVCNWCATIATWNGVFSSSGSAELDMGPFSGLSQIQFNP